MKNTWEIQHGDNGEEYKIDSATGEVRMKHTIEIFEGDTVLSLEQRESQRRYRESEEQRKRRRNLSKHLGQHFFIESSQNFPGLSPSNAARLVFLATYSDYSNRLRLTQKTVLKKEDLPRVLRISKSMVNYFLKEASPKYLQIEDDGQLFINANIFLKGSLPRGNSFYRIYTQWIRILYNSTSKGHYKHLGYIFKLLPFVNFEYNIICHNPQEKEFEMIEPMTLDEFCVKIDYNSSNRHRLLKIYDTIAFNVDNRSEKFIAIVGNGLVKDIGKSKMYINPHILYSGSHFENVKILGKF